MQPVLTFNRSAIEVRLGPASGNLGINSSFDTFYAYGELNIPEYLTILGVKNPDLDHLAAEALKDPSVGCNPIAMNAEKTMASFEACLKALDS